VGVGGVLVIRLEIETWVTGKGVTKMGAEKEWAVGRKGMRAAGFCGLYMY
jgi:hypothetical protein